MVELQAPRRRGLPRWLLYVGLAVGAFVLLGLIGGTIAFMATGGAVKVADDFFATDAAQGPAAAWAKASPSFQAASPEPMWEAVSHGNGLGAFKSTSWSDRSVSGATAELKGVLNLSGGSALPVTVDLVKGAGGWQVQSLQFANAGVQPPAGVAAPMVPGDKLADACRGILAKTVTLDTITCPPLMAVKGATTQCQVTRGQSHGVMKVTLEDVDSTGQATMDCAVDPSVAPAAGGQ
ncbi:MAG: hypothetical protein JO303_03600 [Caulobacteraceae bacterium]|nr:hypothetical protein [Caulobacteraceae bacterium]